MNNHQQQRPRSAPLTGIILAGGQARRMGRDKAEILFRGKSLLDRAINLLCSLPVDDIVVLGREGAEHGVADETPHLGPARAIKAWLERQPKPAHLIVIPVDMPALGHDQLNRLLTQPGGAYYHDLYLPFYAPNAQINRLKDNIVRMRDILSGFQLTELKAPSEWRAPLMNVNTPEDLHTLEQTFPE